MTANGSDVGKRYFMCGALSEVIAGSFYTPPIIEQALINQYWFMKREKTLHQPGILYAAFLVNRRRVSTAAVVRPKRELALEPSGSVLSRSNCLRA